MNRTERDAHLRQTCSDQYGLVSRAQAVESGFSASALARHVRVGTLERVQPGVYRMAGAADSWRQKLLAACLAAGPDAAVSHLAAAALLGYEGMYAGRVDIVSPRWQRRPKGNLLRLHESTDLIPADLIQVYGIPVTGHLRTTLDIGCMVSAEQLESIVVESLRRGHYSYRQLRHRHRQISKRGRNGSGAMWDLVKEFDRAGRLAHSGWEIRLDRLIRKLGFPRPVRQHRIVDENGNFVAQVDLAYPDERIVIEADSQTWHLGNDSFHHDRERWNTIRSLGWEVLVYTYRHYLHNHHHISETLGRSLQNRGKLRR